MALPPPIETAPQTKETTKLAPDPIKIPANSPQTIVQASAPIRRTGPIMAGCSTVGQPRKPLAQRAIWLTR